jgi:hypothetical protein
MRRPAQEAKMIARIGRLRACLAPLAALVGLLALSACVVEDRVYYDDGDAYRYQHRQHGLYNDYEYRRSYYDDNGYRYEAPTRVYYYDDGYVYDEGYGYRHRD